ncbi:MAG: tRNA epoxyqueuosine(34) reductase QueG [Phycisphaerales bacterium JB038]
MPVAEPAIIATIRGECERLGFARWGLCAADPIDRPGEWRRFIDEGRQGEMDWLRETLEMRLDPTKLLAGARSILMVADLYACKGAEAGREPVEAGQGKVARYARGRDYHKVLKKRLHQLADALREALPDESFRAAVDTAPLAEREYAARAGLGWIGKHTLVIHPELGSYFFLGALLTTATLPIPQDQAEVPDHCGGCTACLDACPTQALTPYALDARRCLSYLSIEHRGPIDAGLQAHMGDWLFGCDICQEVCPHNSSHARVAAESSYSDYAPRRRSLPLVDILNWGEATRREAVQGTAMTRAKLDMWRRNALICLGNEIPRNPSPRVLERLDEIATSSEEAPSVRQAAAQALRRLA